jgi:hypothetical protein
MRFDGANYVILVMMEYRKCDNQVSDRKARESKFTRLCHSAELKLAAKIDLNAQMS